MSVTVIVGTDRGGFVLRSDAERREWNVTGPFFKGWKVTAAMRDPEGVYFLGTTSMVYGAAIHKSHDLETWAQVDHGPAYAEGAGHKLEQVWKLAAHTGAHYAGVAEAGLFRSMDGGNHWEPVSGINDHPTRGAWMPGAGGLCAHTLLFDSTNAQRMWCGISAVGVFRTEDGGDTWHTKNDGVPVILEDQNHEGIGYCIHALVQDPDDPSLIWRQDHRGMFRTRDGGDHWERIENGLPSGFGFPLVLDHRTRTLFCFPLESDEYRMPPEGRFRVYRSEDQGEHWAPLTHGLPQSHSYDSVMRNAMDVDQLDPCGVYVGSTSGKVYVSADRGDSWQCLPCTLPRIHCVSAEIEA